MVPSVCLETVASFHPGVMTIAAQDRNGCFALPAALQVIDVADNVDAIGIGPGMTTCTGSIAVVERVLAITDIPRVIDADALNVIAMAGWTPRLSGPIVLTPHPGELQRLTGAGPKNRAEQITAAEEIAEATDAVIVVKGGPTVVVSPTEKWTNTTGNPGMATAGSGDLLTGVITSLLGQGLTVWDAARLGVWIHGLAGDMAAEQFTPPGVTCVEIAQSIGHATNQAVG